MRHAILVALLISVATAVPTNAGASCLKKTGQIDQIIARLVDLSETSDISQQTRDKSAIRDLETKVSDEDCVGATPELQRLGQLALSVSNNIDVLNDYGLSDAEQRDRLFFTIPLQIQAYYSHDSSQTVSCRCYARQHGVLNVFSEMASLLSTYRAVKMTSREVRAVFAWYKILDGYLSDLIGVHVASVKQISSTDLVRIRNTANSALQKHCGFTLFSNTPDPAYGECKFLVSSKPTPVPTGTP